MRCRVRLIDRHTVEREDGARLPAPHILLATGGHPRRPSVPGAEHGLVSDDFFNFCEAPSRVAIVGAGYVAVELAGVLQALGSQVELFVRGQRLLDSFEPDLTAELLEDTKQHGIHARFGYSLAGVEST